MTTGKAAVTMKGLMALANTTTLLATKEALQKTITELPNYKNNATKAIVTKGTELYDNYKNFSGATELDALQMKINKLQDRLLEAQDKRREIGEQLTTIRKQSNDLQEELHKVKRQEDLQRFLNLMKEETELLKLEQQLSKEFNEHDRTERDVFTAFTNAIRTSHERQRAYLEKTKYWGWTLSILGSFLSFMFSSLRSDELKKVVKQQLVISHEPIIERLERSDQLMQEAAKSVRAENEKLIVVAKAQKTGSDSSRDWKQAILDQIEAEKQRKEKERLKNDVDLAWEMNLLKYALYAAGGFIVMRILVG